MIIPIDFIVEKVTFNWSELLWGYRHQLLGWYSVVEFAVYRLVTEQEEDDLEIELAGLGKNETYRVSELVHHLGSRKPVADDVQEKWLYLSLLWLYETREQYTDPLGEVELLYSNFEYPNSIAEFVRYMPVSGGYDPEKNSKAENIDRMYRKWQIYLHQQSDRWPVSSK